MANEDNTQDDSRYSPARVYKETYAEAKRLADENGSSIVKIFEFAIRMYSEQQKRRNEILNRYYQPFDGGESGEGQGE